MFTRMKPCSTYCRQFGLLMALASAWMVVAAQAEQPKAEGGAPGIAEQPISRIATESNQVTFSLSVTGAAPLVFQWWKNDQPFSNSTRVTGATGAVLNIDPVQVADTATYFAIVTNANGAVTSTPVSLVVSQLLFQITPMGGTGALVTMLGQIGDVYRIEVSVDFAPFVTNGYATNITGRTEFFDRNTGGFFRNIRARFDQMLPVLYPATPPTPRTIRAYGKLNQAWRFQGTSDFQTWDSLLTVTNTTGWVKFTDQPLLFLPHRFYRIAPP
jgi:hypothetical protein